ncbi:NAD(P)/FAD-dependent oxidoreductase [Halomonas sp. WWR20]
MLTRRKFILGTGAGLLTFGAGAGIGALSTAKGGWIHGSDIPRAEPVATSSGLPERADVVIVGGGIAGLLTAHFLNARGFDVVVLEKGVVAGEQSSRAFGWVAAGGAHPDKLELSLRSREIWKALSDQSPVDLGYRRNGSLSVLGDEQAVEAKQAWLDEARERLPEIDSRLISGSELADRLPGAAQTYAGALFTPNDGMIEPTFTVPRIARQLESKGVRIIQRCAVRTVETEAGAVSHVVTEKGAIRTSNVVVAGGAWSRMFLGNLGVSFPQLGIASPLMRISAAEGPDGVGSLPTSVWRRRVNGEYIVGSFMNVSSITRASFEEFLSFRHALSHSKGILSIRFGRDFFESLRMPKHWSGHDVTPFERNRFLYATPLESELQTRFDALRMAFPSFENSTVQEQWAGVIDATPDSTPVISAIDEMPGLSLISGFSGNGLLGAPASGELMAQIIAGETPTVDPEIYRYNRFFDGTELTFRH